MRKLICGENASALRAGVCRDAHWRWVAINAAANEIGATQMHTAAGLARA